MGKRITPDQTGDQMNENSINDKNMNGTTMNPNNSFPITLSLSSSSLSTDLNVISSKSTAMPIHTDALADNALINKLRISSNSSLSGTDRKIVVGEITEALGVQNNGTSQNNNNNITSTTTNNNSTITLAYSPGRMIRQDSNYGKEAPWTRPKTGRQITFADERGDILHHVTYSERTHYSRRSAPSANKMAAVARAGCCIIS